MTMLAIRPAARGRVDTLPKWAQAHIEILERIVDEQQERLSQGPEGSDTFLDPYEDNRPLGPGARVRFMLGESVKPYGQEYVDVQVAHHREHVAAQRPLIQVMTAGDLILLPRSSNLALIGSSHDD